MARTPEEQAHLEGLSRLYRLGPSQVMREIERRICGCDYGGTSWTTRPATFRFRP